MIIIRVFFLVQFFFNPALDTNVSSSSDDLEDYLNISTSLLEALKAGESTIKYQSILENSTLNELETQLDSDKKIIAFWVNIYNAYIQIRLGENPGFYEDRRSFFKKPLINIASENMSFADIEHGILRRAQCELLLGYFRNPFVAKYKKKLKPKKLDYRIHFALNCGAKSCPPVAIYHADDLDRQLDASAKLFLSKFSSYDEQNNEITTTPLFSWFRGDFKGKRGVKRILEKYEIIPNRKVKLKFDNYDWTLALDNYIEI